MLEMVNTGHQNWEGLKIRKETYDVILGCSGENPVSFWIDTVLATTESCRMIKKPSWFEALMVCSFIQNNLQWKKQRIGSKADVDPILLLSKIPFAALGASYNFIP